VRILTLRQMLTRLRAEARLSANVAHGAHLEAGHITLLERVQDDLYLANDWPMLQITETVNVPAGVRYSTYPTNIAFEGISRAFAKTSTGDWHELTYGVGVEQLIASDSDAGATGDEVTHWQNYIAPSANPLTQNMFELWPVPAAAVDVRFTGKRTLQPLVNPDTDYSTIDGPVIFLTAAAELLAAQKAEDASLKLRAAAHRMELLRRRQTAPDNRRISLSGGFGKKPPRRGIDYT